MENGAGCWLSVELVITVRKASLGGIAKLDMPVNMNAAGNAVQSVGMKRCAVIVAAVLLHAPGRYVSSLHLQLDTLLLLARSSYLRVVNLDSRCFAIKNLTFEYLNNEKVRCSVRRFDKEIW